MFRVILLQIKTMVAFRLVESMKYTVNDQVVYSIGLDMRCIGEANSIGKLQ